MNKTPLCLVILPLCWFLAGCGTDEYQSRLDRASSGAGTDTKYSALGAETTVPGTTVGLRVPKVMQSVDISDAVRGKCPLFEISGLKATYEGNVEDSVHNKQHYYLYVALSEQGANNFSPAKAWLAELQQKFPNSNESSTAVNTNYSVPTPEGSSVQYEEIHFKCNQKLSYTKPDNTLVNQDMPGTLVCLCHAEKGAMITLIYRYPSSLADRHSTDFDADWIKLIAGCMKVGGGS